MWNMMLLCFLQRTLIVLGLICVQVCFSSLSLMKIRETVYYHNVYRYMLTIGSTKNQPMSSDMKMMRWNQSLAMSIESMPDECVLIPYRDSCPPVNVYRIKRQTFDIIRIVRTWFDINKYYDYGRDTCIIKSCQPYKRMVNSDNTAIGCLIKRIGRLEFFVCQYSGRIKDRPYQVGKPCTACSKTQNSCFKKSFCITKDGCQNMYCDTFVVKQEDYSMQADQPQHCQRSDFNCNIKYFQHMCPKLCSPAKSSFMIKEPTTKNIISTQENDICKLVNMDCSIPYFKIMCRNSCESARCRDPNIDCKNVFYADCKICKVMNGKMSDSKITTTTTLPTIENAIGLSDPKCQDLLHDNYCIDRGEMCSYPTYHEWMKKFCCNTCKILDLCLDYLDVKTPGKCGDILSSGRCDSLWSHTYCRKTCKKC